MYIALTVYISSNYTIFKVLVTATMFAEGAV